MKVLAVNAGSSSLKSTLFQMPEQRPLATGHVERIGDDETSLVYKAGRLRVERPCAAADHPAALRALVDCMLNEEGGVLGSLDEVVAVGHRVVHGGEMSHSVVVDAEVEAVIRRYCDLAPLHNPYNLAGVEAARQMLPDRPQVAVFDTAFHTTMPPAAYMYALPYELYEERGVRAYGFHGISHRYVSGRAATMLGLQRHEADLITLHLGNGCSAAAVKGGRCVETSMGLTPLEGLVMGTRSGDVDPGLFHLLSEWMDATPAEVYDIYNRRSGLLGLSGISNDVRELLAAAAEGDRRAELALDVFAHRVRKYLGAYLAVLGRADAVVFTAGIGENSAEMRRRICSGLGGLGIALDEEGNAAAVGREAVISAAGSPTAILIVPTDEALQIAIETCETLNGDCHS